VQNIKNYQNSKGITLKKEYESIFNSRNKNQIDLKLVLDIMNGKNEIFNIKQFI
jgi:hypothetical protein